MLLSNGSNLLNNSPATTMSNMEVHQNFIKQINLLNQTAPSMLGQKLGIAVSMFTVPGTLQSLLCFVKGTNVQSVTFCRPTLSILIDYTTD